MKPYPHLLSGLAAISSMEKGKLCSCAHRPSSEDAGYCRLQYRENGRNVSRHVTAAEVPALREAIDGYQRARELIEQYLDSIVAETRHRLAGSKQKPPPPPRPSRGKPRWEPRINAD